MARGLNRLTVRQVATLKKPGRHADGGNLYLQVTRSGTKQWVFFFQLVVDHRVRRRPKPDGRHPLAVKSIVPSGRKRDGFLLSVPTSRAIMPTMLR